MKKLDYVKVKEIHEIDIDDVNQEGQGIGRVNGFVVFVAGALPGERVRVEIVKVDKSYATGKIIKLVCGSADRAEPFCESFRECGGCGFQHLAYDAQLRWKKSIVENALRRIGGLVGANNVLSSSLGDGDSVGEVAGSGKVNDTIGMDKPFKYRNKAQFPVGCINNSKNLGNNQSLGNTRQITAGFYKSRTHDIIDIGHCGIHDDYANEVKEIVKEFMNDKLISAYSEITGKGLVRHIVTRTAKVTGEVMVILVINGYEIPMIAELTTILLTQIPQIKTIVLNANTRKTNIIFGDKNITVYGDGHIFDYIGKYKFKLSPLSFYQVNHTQAEVLYAKALEYAALTGNETVFDLYCGVGTISLYVSGQAKKVYGVEIVGAAIADAKENAKINGVDNVEFIEGKAEEVIPHLYKQGITTDVVIVDPPRKGCDQKLLDTILKMSPARIVYVSCNPATLARDLKYLSTNGNANATKPAEHNNLAIAQTPTYTVQAVQPVDMFPWTGHVETVVWIERVEV